MAAMPPLPALSILRDLSYKVRLEPQLEAEVLGFLDRPLPEQAGAKKYLEEAGLLVQRCVASLEGEIARANEQRFSISDPGTLKLRLVGEPRRQADNLLAALKQKLANEKQEWGRRIAKQLADSLQAAAQEVSTLAVQRTDRGEEHLVKADAQWARSFDGWQEKVFQRWTSHVAELLPAKTQSLLAPELRALAELLGQGIDVPMPRADLPRPSPAAVSVFDLEERFELPSTTEVFMETFKGGLSTVAMLAGMIVVPVVGSFMQEATTRARAVVMTAMVIPILLLAVARGRRQHAKLIISQAEKAKEKLRKDLESAFKTRGDRFRPELERACGLYLAAVQQ